MRQGSASVDVEAAIYGGRRYPGICERDDCSVNGENVRLFRDRAGLKLAEIECHECLRCWRRVGQ